MSSRSQNYSGISVARIFLENWSNGLALQSFAGTCPRLHFLSGPLLTLFQGLFPITNGIINDFRTTRLIVKPSFLSWYKPGLYHLFYYSKSICQKQLQERIVSITYSQFMKIRITFLILAHDPAHDKID